MRRRWLAAPLLAVVLVGCSSTQTTSITPPKPTTITAADQAQLSQAAVDTFASGLMDASATGSTPAVRSALTAGHQMHVTSVAFQYLDSIALTSTDLQQFGPSVWAAEISTSYRLPFDPGPTEMTIAMVFKPTASGAEIV